MRRLSYRHAITTFFFTGCWLVFGFLFLMTPIPDALGVGGQLIGAWIFLFFVFLAISGSLLTLAAFNGIFPPVQRSPRQATARPATTGAPDPSTQAWTRPLPPRSSGGR
jgi:hypothetical protein